MTPHELTREEAVTCACGRPAEINPATGKWFDSWQGDPQCAACHEREMVCLTCGHRFVRGDRRAALVSADPIKFLCQKCLSEIWEEKEEKGQPGPVPA